MQGQKDGIIHELRADLQLATDKLSIAEQDREMAMACLASAPRSHSTALHELQVRLQYQVVNSLGKLWSSHLHEVM